MKVAHHDLESSQYVTWAKFLAETDNWQSDQVRQYQLDNVRRIVSHAYATLKGYRALFDTHAVRPEDIRSLEDVRRLPFTTKELFRDNLESFSSKTIDSEYVTTGGSTGVPMGLYRSRAEFAKELASKAHQYHRVGWREGDRQIVFRGLKIDSPNGMSFVEEFDELRCSTYEFGSDRMELYRQKAIEYRPDWIRCYPSSGFVFASYLKDSEKAFPMVKGMLCSSERLYPFQAELFKEVFGPSIRIFSHYGHYEMAALAGFCEHTDHYHVLPQYGYVELLDKDDQPVTTPGDVGEIVATSLIMETTPFIRYRTQDLAVYRGSSCSKCGRPYQLWERVEGRLQELIVTRTGRLVSTSMLNMHDDSYDHILKFQFHQRRRGGVIFRYVPKRTFNDDVRASVYARIKDKLGDDIELEMESVIDIPLTKRGKHRLLIQDLDLSYSHPSLEKPITL
jgi:phenylacetate-CoA ligase